MTQNSTHPEKTDLLPVATSILRTVPFSAVPDGWYFEHGGEIFIKISGCFAALPHQPSVVATALWGNAPVQIL
jgi:hypothetical protein